MSTSSSPLTPTVVRAGAAVCVQRRSPPALGGAAVAWAAWGLLAGLALTPMALGQTASSAAAPSSQPPPATSSSTAAAGGGDTAATATASAEVPTALPSNLVPPTPSGEPSPEDKETARKLYQQGHERYRAADYRAALVSFATADRIMGVPTTGLEVGRTEAKLGLLVQARDRLLKVVRYPRLPDESEPFARARVEAEALSREIAERIPSLQIEVRTAQGVVTDQPTTKVHVDLADVPPELRLVPRSLNPGRHVVQVSAPGFVAQRQTVVLREREQRVLQLTLVPRGDGDEIADQDLGAEGSGISPVAWVGFGVGGAALLAGVITGGLTLSKESSLADQCPDKKCPESARDALRSARTLGDASTALLVAGGVGVGIGLASLLMSLYGHEEAEPPPDATEARAPHFELRPLLGPTAVGIGGRF